VVRAKWQRARFLVSRLAGRPLPAWAVAETEGKAAEALSAIPLDEAAQECLEFEEFLAPRAQPGEAACANGCVAHELRGEDPGSPTAGASSAAMVGPSANGCVAHELGSECFDAGAAVAVEAGATTGGGAKTGASPTSRETRTRDRAAPACGRPRWLAVPQTGAFTTVPKAMLPLEAHDRSARRRPQAGASATALGTKR
jgi:hypothetical protein